ncbi:alpha/beta-hydrolase [Lojkania enalia]|uniref:Alpha/beta-hydrolase n=1 Tax=Lojkania enalia TaxID=147567 RepID=A0A9P4MYC7_9PLEO|nr:alpha/beta-hydrolase [Didymosphaeria enalia]
MVQLPPPYSYCLWTKVFGTRKGREPVVVLLTGGGAPCKVYARLAEELGGWRCVVVYDRAGYGESGEMEKKKIMATDSAEELAALLHVLRVRGPYVLLGHSYGAIIAREFVELMNNRDGVVGLALIEPASELLYHTYTPSIPPPAFDSLLRDVDVEKVLHLREESGLTDEEWDAMMEAISRTLPNARYEDCRSSGRILAGKKQMMAHVLDPWPVAVLRCNWYRDWKKLFVAGVVKGNGSVEEREEAQKFLWDVEVFDDEVRAGLVRRYRYFDDCGRDVPLRRPDVVREEVGWVMELLRERGLE